MSTKRRLHLHPCLLALAGFLFAAVSVGAHAILVESNPAPNSKIHGPAVSVRLRFNSRIDGSRSHLALVRPDGASDTLKIQDQSSPDALASEATGLKPGVHHLRWQVLAADGHITRGEIVFTVVEN